MDFKSFEAVVDFAIEKEKQAVEFYEHIAEQAPFPSVKETLLGFAKEELKHQAKLESLKKNDLKIDDYKFTWIPDLKRSDYIVDVAYEKRMSYVELLRLAMKREEKSLKLYNELIVKVEKKELVTVFKILAQEEADHKLKLETLYDDFMSKQGD
jgi:rubrerythrin